MAGKEKGKFFQIKQKPNYSGWGGGFFYELKCLLFPKISFWGFKKIKARHTFG